MIDKIPAKVLAQVPTKYGGLHPQTLGSMYKWYTGEAMFKFGFKLHYTTFDFSWEETRGKPMPQAVLDSFNVSVTNTGNVTSDYVALLFARTSEGPSPAPIKELVAYIRVKSIPPRESRIAKLKVTLGAIARTDEEGHLVLYPGSYEILLNTDGVTT
ncbi:hypothetical protein L218DRAFT_950885 [Marasmius fiardii PR-910]|nr:hypothetical protein L218DRAFT_950885 [Marasmius fiardii PR-910]